MIALRNSSGESSGASDNEMNHRADATTSTTCRQTVKVGLLDRPLTVTWRVRRV